MVTTTFIALALGLAAPKIDLNVADLANGDSINAERRFRVTVQSDHPVRSVEFYVNDELRDSDTSTPYEFKLDPINEKQGEITVSFAAYDADGGQAKKTYKVKVDVANGQTAEQILEKGQDALVARKFDDAVYLGRVALKLRDGWVPARMLLARGFLGQGVYDKAQQFAEDAIAADASNTEAKEVLAGINLRKAFDTLSTGTDRTMAVGVITTALKTAAELRKQNLDARFDAMAQPTDTASTIKYADAAIRASRFNAASGALAKEFASKPQDPALGNRLVYAYLRQYRLADAAYSMSRMVKEKTLDAYGYSLLAIISELQGRPTDADKAMADAQGNDPRDLGVRTAQAYLSMKRNRTDNLRQIVSSLQTDAGGSPEAMYYLAVAQARAGDLNYADESFKSAVLSEPAFVDAYLDRGNQSFLLRLRGGGSSDEQALRSKMAEAYYGAALAAKPDSAPALTAMALLSAHQGKFDNALTFAEGAIAASPTYPAGQFAAAYVFSEVDRNYAGRATSMKQGVLSESTRAEIAKLEGTSAEAREKGKAALKKALELDAYNLQGRTLPNLVDAFDYFNKHGRLPLLSNPR